MTGLVTNHARQVGARAMRRTGSSGNKVRGGRMGSKGRSNGNGTGACAHNAAWQEEGQGVRRARATYNRCGQCTNRNNAGGRGGARLGNA